jgi:hypothetical protein
VLASRDGIAMYGMTFDDAGRLVLFAAERQDGGPDPAVNPIDPVKAKR